MISQNLHILQLQSTDHININFSSSCHLSPCHHRGHRHSLPPDTSNMSPVVKDAASDARNRMALAHSSGLPARPRGWSVLASCVRKNENTSQYVLMHGTIQNSFFSPWVQFGLINHKHLYVTQGNYWYKRQNYDVVKHNENYLSHFRLKEFWALKCVA